MKALHLFDIEEVDHIISPENFSHTTLESPASKIFTDFKRAKALVIDADTTAAMALEMMMQEHVRMKIVVSELGDVLGVISANELTERRLVSEIAKGVTRNDVLVSDLMVPCRDLRAFDYQELRQSKVSDVIQALKDNGLRHCLVIDREHHHIRGVISSSDIARKLRLPLEISSEASFKHIFEVVRGYKQAC
ncbi:CBS domain-containing protein [Thalassotalea sediminis]|uniref:CBS domain-containing protein n=1 Tax=Thalassotalea sediminis TaxID=1759089 RepID=UPI002572C090|nr:CBS domain-containing protein [Thalassotalea sediminis]